MNWLESSALAMLGFFASIYLILVFLTSPRKPRKERKHGQGFRPVNPRDGYDFLRPHELRGAADDEIAEFVRNRLHLRPGLAGVEVSVRNREVRLSGRVSTIDDRDLAGNVARSVPQVKAVVNEIRVRALENRGVA